MGSINIIVGSYTDDLYDFLYLNIEDPITAKILSCDEEELDNLIIELIDKEDEIE